MIDPAAPLQKAQFEILKNDLAIKTFFGSASPRIYDRPPKDPKFPYVTIGDDQVLDDRAEGLDASEVYTRTHVWSKDVGVVEAKKLSALVAKALDAELPVEGHRVVEHAVESIQAGAATDPLISHRIVEHRYLTEPTT